MNIVGRPPVVVGVDGSARDAAVLWRAVLAARSYDVPLLVVHVVGRDLARGHEVLDAARRAVEAAGGLPEVSYDLRAGSPDVVLRCPAMNATLLVLGAPGTDRPPPRPSCAELLAASNPAPVLVVRGAGPHSGPVVAAVDGSYASEHVLAYAMEEAEHGGRALTLLHVTDGRSDLPRGLGAVVSTWQAKYPEVAVAVRVRVGDPAALLAEESHRSGLLVFAARPPGHFAANLLGAVGRHVLYAAESDVAVV